MNVQDNREIARSALERARLVQARADDPSLWWQRAEPDEGPPEIRTHLLRRDGTWSLYRVDGLVARELAAGRDST